VWTVELNGAAPGSPAVDANGTLFVGTFGKSVQAVDTSRGLIAWSVPTEGWVWGGPLLVNDVLYLGDLEGNFYSLNSSGKPDGEQFQPDGPILASPIAIGEQVIFVTENGTVYAAENGTDPKSLEKMEGKLYTAPVAAGDLILVAPFQGEFLLVALDQQGKQAWTFTPGN
jgi:outer membrane protein assembly factor BamB